MELNLQKLLDRNPAGAFDRPVRNIIFDFGGVICDIDVRLTEKAFMELGLKKFDKEHSIKNSVGLFEDIETGKITPKQFRDALRTFLVNPVSDEQLDHAWNALLMEIPEPRIRLLEALRTHYHIFLLSNTTKIHYDCYAGKLKKQFGYNSFEDLFEKAWFSYNIGLKKPSLQIFEYVLRDGHLDPAETLFIDDTLMHVEGARKAGIHGYHLEIDRGEHVLELFHEKNA
jgi:glucose-1-phosphatase